MYSAYNSKSNNQSVILIADDDDLCLDAYSASFRPPIPEKPSTDSEAVHRFRSKPSTDSGANRPLLMTISD